MTLTVTVNRATADGSHEVAVMVGELLSEIMNVIGVQAFNFGLEETTDRLTNEPPRVLETSGGHNATPSSF